MSIECIKRVMTGWKKAGRIRAVIAQNGLTGRLFNSSGILTVKSIIVCAARGWEKGYHPAKLKARWRSL